MAHRGWQIIQSILFECDMHFLMWRPFKNRAIPTYGVDSGSWKTYIKLVVNHGGENLQLVIIYSCTINYKIKQQYYVYGCWLSYLVVCYSIWVSICYIVHLWCANFRLETLTWTKVHIIDGLQINPSQGYCIILYSHLILQYDKYISYYQYDIYLSYCLCLAFLCTSMDFKLTRVHFLSSQLLQQQETQYGSQQCLQVISQV